MFGAAPGPGLSAARLAGSVGRGRSLQPGSPGGRGKGEGRSLAAGERRRVFEQTPAMALLCCTSSMLEDGFNGRLGCVYRMFHTVVWCGVCVSFEPSSESHGFFGR